MGRNEILILDRKLVETIDEYRADLSRAEFVEMCIDCCLEGIKPEEKEREERYPPARELPVKEREPTAYATREDFQEFKRSVKDLLRAFLDFFITFSLELGPIKTTEDLESLKSQLRSMLEK